MGKTREPNHRTGGIKLMEVTKETAAAVEGAAVERDEARLSWHWVSESIIRRSVRSVIRSRQEREGKKTHSIRELENFIIILRVFPDLPGFSVTISSLRAAALDVDESLDIAPVIKG
jgi:hypothetical protein